MAADNIKPETQKIFSDNKGGMALRKLKKILKKYHRQHVLANIEKQTHIPIVNKTKKETGTLYLQENQFRLITKSSPASLTVFDGDHLWYQANTEEKSVLKSAAHPDVYLFSNIFNLDKFFEFFKVTSFEKTSSVYVYHLTPIQQSQGIQTVILSVGNQIQELKITWKNLENTQTYRFRKTWFKKRFASHLFTFPVKDFRITSQ